MDIIRGALPRTRRNDHEQDHPHPKAQRAALLCGGAGVRGTVRGAADIQIMGAAGGAGRCRRGLWRGKKDLPAPGGGARGTLPHRCGGCGPDADRYPAEAGHPARTERGFARSAAVRCHDPHGKGGRSIVETVEANPPRQSRCAGLPTTICRTP